MKCFAWIDADLDGAMSYLTLKWMTGLDIDVRVTTVKNFRNEFLAWSRNHKVEDYKKIFFLDLDTGPHKDLIDIPNAVIFDHHLSHAENAEYKKATNFVKVDTSCCKLVLNKFKKPIDNYKKALIALVDDYDSYKLKNPNSLKLNTVFWNYNGNRVQKFENDFGEGFRGFNVQHKNVIRIHEKRLANTKNNLDLYVCNTTMFKNKVKMVSFMCNYAINEVADYVLDKYKADIVIVVNDKNSGVSFRKNKDTCPVHLDKLAAKLCNGGGHEYAAGGKVNEGFMDFLKHFKPL